MCSWQFYLILTLIALAINVIFQGRALLNAIGNLELTGGYAEALEKLGHTLESVASQVSVSYGNFTCTGVIIINYLSFHF